MANVAQEFHRSSNRDVIQYLDDSRSSVAETVSHAFAARDRSFVTQQEMKALQEQADVVRKSTDGFMAYRRREVKAKLKN